MSNGRKTIPGAVCSQCHARDWIVRVGGSTTDCAALEEGPVTSPVNEVVTQ